MHIDRASWQREEGSHWRGELSSLSGRGRELHSTPSQTLLFPSLFLFPQGLVKEPIVPSQETAVTKHRVSSGGRRKWCLFTKSLRMFGFTTSVQSPFGFPSLTHPHAHEHQDVGNTLCPVVPVQAILRTPALLFIFRCFPTHLSVHI